MALLPGLPFVLGREVLFGRVVTLVVKGLYKLWEDKRRRQFSVGEGVLRVLSPEVEYGLLWLFYFIILVVDF